jgi:hypothetical protein
VADSCELGNNVQISKKVGKVLISSAATDFSRSVLLHRDVHTYLIHNLKIKILMLSEQLI